MLFVLCCDLRISVNSNNVQSLLNAANQYQIEPVKKMCVDFLKEQVDATNCLGETPPSFLWKTYFYSHHVYLINHKIIICFCELLLLILYICNYI